MSTAGGELRTPRAAAVAGIVFSVLLGLALVLIRLAVPADPRDAGMWLSDPRARTAALWGLRTVPFAGIAFIWFMGVVRDRLGQLEDRFFASVFLGSGLLFVATLFVSVGIAEGLVNTHPGSDVWKLGRAAAFELSSVFTMRMAAVFTMTTATLLLRTRLISRWLGLSGYAVGAVLLVLSGVVPFVELVFPLWVLLVSVHVLLANLRAGRAQAQPRGDQ